MAGGWAESLTRTVEMPDDEPGTFAFYIFWLYYGSLPVFEAKYTFSRDVNLLSLVKAYVLGDKLLDDNFQDATIDFIIEGRDQSRSPPGWLPVGEVIEYTYKNTRKSSPLRRLFLDMYAREGYPEWLTDPSWGDASQIPQPFLFDLALKQMSDTIKFDFTPGYLVESSRYYVGSRVVADEDDSSEDD